MEKTKAKYDVAPVITITSQAPTSKLTRHHKWLSLKPHLFSSRFNPSLHTHTEPLPHILPRPSNVIPVSGWCLSNQCSRYTELGALRTKPLPGGNSGIDRVMVVRKRAKSALCTDLVPPASLPAAPLRHRLSFLISPSLFFSVFSNSLPLIKTNPLGT